MLQLLQSETIGCCRLKRSPGLSAMCDAAREIAHEHKSAMAPSQ